METWNFRALPEELNTAYLGLFDVRAIRCLNTELTTRQIREGHGEALQKRLIGRSSLRWRCSSCDFA